MGQFSGCIRDFKIGGREISGGNLAQKGTIPCTSAIENGIFFGKSGGYVKLRDKFKVGTQFDVSLDIKPRTQNALLLSVHGKSSYLILQLYKGSLLLLVNNGDGQFNVTATLSNDENFCDGQWRNIVVNKSKFVASLTIDGVHYQPTIGTTKFPSTDTTRPLFLGGHLHLQKARDIVSRQPYQGCIRNVVINNVPEPISVSQAVGHVSYGVCFLN